MANKRKEAKKDREKITWKKKKKKKKETGKYEKKENYGAIPMRSQTEGKKKEKKKRK